MKARLVDVHGRGSCRAPVPVVVRTGGRQAPGRPLPAGWRPHPTV